MVSRKPESWRNSGVVQTRVLSNNSGDMATPWMKPPIPPERISLTSWLIVRLSWRRYIVCACPNENTAPLVRHWMKPHGKKPSSNPNMPFFATRSRVICAYERASACFEILRISKKWPPANASNITVTVPPITVLASGLSGAWPWPCVMACVQLD